jgi:hypothetical protein
MATATLVMFRDVTAGDETDQDVQQDDPDDREYYLEWYNEGLQDIKRLCAGMKNCSAHFDHVCHNVGTDKRPRGLCCINASTCAAVLDGYVQLAGPRQDRRAWKTC